MQQSLLTRGISVHINENEYKSKYLSVAHRVVLHEVFLGIIHFVIQNKLKICFIVDYYPPDRLGGVGESARYLKEALEAKGHFILVITTGTRSTSEPLERNVIRLTKSLWNFPLKLLYHMPQFIKTYKFDLIHMHHTIGITALFMKHIRSKTFPTIIATYKCSRSHIVKSIKPIKIAQEIICKPHISELRTKITFSILHLADAYLARVSHFLTANSHDTRRKNIRVLKVNHDKIMVIPNGIAVHAFNQKAVTQNIRQKLGISQQTFLLLYVGGFSVRKRVPWLFYIIKELKDHNYSCHLLITGNSKHYLAQYHQIISNLAIQDRITFAGFVRNEDLPSYYASCDAVTVPSEYEPFGIINIEAMAMGKTVIASDVGGISDIIRHEKNGFLIAKDDFTQYCQVIIKLITTKKLKMKIGRNALTMVKQKFSWDKVSETYISCYHHALASRKTQSC